jgi:hypothetical protein
MSGACVSSNAPMRAANMVEAVSLTLATTFGVHHARRSRQPTHGAGCRLSRAERLEMMFAAASQGIGECSIWMILALEASEEPDVALPDPSPPASSSSASSASARRPYLVLYTPFTS